MKTLIKILIGISILLLFTGMVCAAHNNEIFTAPSGLHPLGYNDFVDEKGHNIMIMEDTSDNRETWFVNDTDPEYLVEPYEANNSFYLGVDDDNDCYIFEVVEKDGTNYIISSWTPNDTDYDFKLIWQNLQDFNKLNHITPLEV